MQTAAIPIIKRPRSIVTMKAKQTTSPFQMPQLDRKNHASLKDAAPDVDAKAAPDIGMMHPEDGLAISDSRRFAVIR